MRRVGHSALTGDEASTESRSGSGRSGGRADERLGTTTDMEWNGTGLAGCIDDGHDVIFSTLGQIQQSPCRRDRVSTTNATWASRGGGDSLDRNRKLLLEARVIRVRRQVNLHKRTISTAPHRHYPTSVAVAHSLG